MTDLLPCPFCGTEPRLIDGRDNEVGYFVRCEYCRIDYPSSVLNAAEKAIALWNTRAHLPGLPQEVPQRDPMLAAVASLAAAISLLERTPRAKKAAPSDKMFDQMLADYRKALANARDALALSRPHREGGK